MRPDFIFTVEVYDWIFSDLSNARQPTRTVNQIDNITARCDSLNRSMQLIIGVTKAAVRETAIL
jgi:hypothetical protein